MKNQEQEEFGINIYSTFEKQKHAGIITVTIPKYNEYGNIISFESDIARFKEENDALVPTNDILGNFTKAELEALYVALHGNTPKANKVKILPPIKGKLIKFE